MFRSSVYLAETVIYRIDKKCYSVVDFKFDYSAETLPVGGLKIDGKQVSHARYFEERKNIRLKYPRARPMIEVLGRRKDQKIFLPAELVCGNELDADVKVRRAFVFVLFCILTLRKRTI